MPRRLRWSAGVSAMQQLQLVRGRGRVVRQGLCPGQIPRGLHQRGQVRGLDRGRDRNFQRAERDLRRSGRTRMGRVDRVGQLQRRVRRRPDEDDATVYDVSEMRRRQ